jgi:hypothetical protein
MLTAMRPRSIAMLTFSFAVTAFALTFLALHLGVPAAQAQEPSPTLSATASPTPSATPTGTRTPTSCAGTSKGGQTVPAVSGATVRLPAGGTYDVLINPPGTADPTFTVCHAESLARVTINALTCREVGESVPNASGALIVAQIVESCTTSEVAGATAVATPPSGAIQPPNTGNAGLATRKLTPEN